VRFSALFYSGSGLTPTTLTTLTTLPTQNPIPNLKNLQNLLNIRQVTRSIPLKKPLLYLQLLRFLQFSDEGVL
jgi:hypothetical protein